MLISYEMCLVDVLISNEMCLVARSEAGEGSGTDDVETGDAPVSEREPHTRACPIAANGCCSARGEGSAAECGSRTILTDRNTERPKTIVV